MEGQSEATLITLREEGSADLAGRPLRIVPAWRWLLEPAPTDAP